MARFSLVTIKGYLLARRVEVNFLSSNWHITLRLTVFEISAVKRQKSVSARPKNGPPEPLYWPCISCPLKISPPKQKGISSFWDTANCHVDHQDIPGRTKTTDTQNLILTKRVLTLRLSDNNEFPVSTKKCQHTVAIHGTVYSVRQSWHNGDIYLPHAHVEYTPCPEKKTDSILAVTLTNLDTFSFGTNHPDSIYVWLKNCKMSHQYLHDTTQWWRNYDFIKKCRFHEKWNATTVASKFAGFKSSWQKCVGEYCKTRCTKHARLISTNSSST